MGRRPWLAAVLAVLYPGLGHVYLRAYGRALLWFGMAVTTAVLVVPESAIEVSSLDALVGVYANLPPGALIAIAAVTAFSVIDAYWLAVRAPAPSADGDAAPTCPSCGEELDPEISFCPWCTHELDADEQE